MPMRTSDVFCLEDPCAAPGRHPGPARPETDRSAKLPAPQGVPPWETIQSALYGAIRFAQTFLGAAGVIGVPLSRVICTPDARHWTLAFGEHFFLVEVVGDGFSVRPFPQSLPAHTA
jgi:hypothetical protein